jgi:hypothetical protein
LLTGVYGSGKSSVAQEIAYLLEQRGEPYALLDLDYLSWGAPEPGTGPKNSGCCCRTWPRRAGDAGAAAAGGAPGGPAARYRAAAGRRRHQRPPRRSPGGGGIDRCSGGCWRRGCGHRQRPPRRGGQFLLRGTRPGVVLSAWRGPTGQLLARTGFAGTPETKASPRRTQLASASSVA